MSRHGMTLQATTREDKTRLDRTGQVGAGHHMTRQDVHDMTRDEMTRSDMT